MPVDVSSWNFDAEVRDSDLPVLVEFHMPSCSACQVFSAYSRGLERRFAGRLKLVRASLAGNKDLFGAHRIESVPAFLLFRNGREVDRLEGSTLRKEELERSIETVLNAHEQETRREEEDRGRV